MPAMTIRRRSRMDSVALHATARVAVTEQRLYVRVVVMVLWAAVVSTTRKVNVERPGRKILICVMRAQAPR
jgi:hypothetical protein